MKAKISLSPSFTFDLPKFLETRALVQANSGGGKSYAIRKLMEETHPFVQQILIDPEGEFATLREKFDYLLVGKNGDTPATTKSAALLARKLMELRISAIIDLSELHPKERKVYVKLFLESMIEAPKELWLTEHPAIVLIDEAHHFAPEKGESVALDAVVDLMSRGRKRGLCGVLATQRISKLNKDASAECNNKLIGRSSQDIDMKRAAEELGFTSKTDMLSLRTLNPGEFYAFGSAMCNIPEKITIGKVQTTHPKVGSRSIRRVAPPNAAIKAVLAKLVDLPEEAQKEASTVAELKAELRSIKAHKCPTVAPAPKVDEKAIFDRLSATFAKAEAEYRERIEAWETYALELSSVIQSSTIFLTQEFKKLKAPLVGKVGKITVMPPRPFAPTINHTPKGERLSFEPRVVAVPASMVEDARKILNTTEGALAKGETVVMTALAQHPEGVDAAQLTMLTGYKRSTRDRYVQFLGQKGYAERKDDLIFATADGIDALGNFQPLPTGQALIEHYMNILPEGEKKIFYQVVQAHSLNVDGVISREDITAATGYQRSTRDRYIQFLQARKLVESYKGMIQLSANIFK